MVWSKVVLNDLLKILALSILSVTDCNVLSVLVQHGCICQYICISVCSISSDVFLII